MQIESDYYVRYELPQDIVDIDEIAWNKYIQFSWIDLKEFRSRHTKAKRVLTFKEIRSKATTRLNRYKKGKIGFEQFKAELIALRSSIVEAYPQHFNDVGYYDKKHFPVQVTSQTP